MSRFTVSPVAGSALTQTARALPEAFGNSIAQTQEWLTFAGAEHVRALSADGAIVGGLLRAPMGQLFGGRAVSTLGIAGVGISPERRRTSAASALLRQALLEAQVAGVTLSTFPLDPSLCYGST
ncbi:MAG: putative acetyltransferase [Bradymonadia bacterium]|jgi:predicted acetyltransferase